MLVGRHPIRPLGRNDREENSMSDFDRDYAAARRGVGADRAIAVDEGLRAYMIRVYNYMAWEWHSPAWSRGSPSMRP